MSAVKQSKGADTVTLTLSAQDARKLLTALTHAVHAGGLKDALGKHALKK